MMKMVKDRTSKVVMCITVTLLAWGAPTEAQQADNAALLYYQAFLLYEKPDTAMDKMLSDFRKGKIGANDAIKEYVEKNRHVIGFVVAAADIPKCDWGYDYSQGFELKMPNLAQLRRVAYLLSTEARLLARQGQYTTALDRCLTMYRMAPHASARTLVSYLVAIALNGLAHGTLQDVLGRMPDGLEELNRIKGQLIQIEEKFPSMQKAIAQEGQVCAATMR
jgi:hypothetical protein